MQGVYREGLLVTPCHVQHAIFPLLFSNGLHESLDAKQLSGAGEDAPGIALHVEISFSSAASEHSFCLLSTDMK